MKSKVLVLAIIVAIFLIFSPVLPAHHAADAVYEKRRVTLRGTVTNFEWNNPHSIVSFMVKDDKGKDEQWHAEILAPAAMARAGWTRESIKRGDQVTLTGRPGKNAQHILWLEFLLTPDGRKLGRTP